MGDKKLTIERCQSDFKRAYQAKHKLIDREREDFLFALGQQWSAEDTAKLDSAGIKPITDNRIAPNLFLLTGLERQNRSDFKAFPEGEEDGIKAEIATSLFKDSIKKSGFQHKASEQFKDGVTCGESHLELYLDYTESLINGSPCWHKVDGNMLFPDPDSREYDFSDARYVYKIKLEVEKESLINLFPKKKSAIEKSTSGKLDMGAMLGGQERHLQRKDYRTSGGDSDVDGDKQDGFDLVERYYKKWVERVFIGDKQTGEIKEAEDADRAESFVNEYKDGIEREQSTFREQSAAYAMVQQVPMTDDMGNPMPLPPAPVEPTPRDPERFIIIKRNVPEIWCYAYIPGMDDPLADERAWFYPKWKQYPFIPYFARFSTAPLTGDDRHLLVQGLVHGVKGVQEKHNKSEMLMVRHLNSATNSGWLSEEDVWVDPQAVKSFGAAPGINLEYKQGRKEPTRIFPMPLSQGHAQMAAESAEAIKAQLGINADLLAAQDGGSSSGRAIALRQRQGLLMVQELFDNLSRSKEIAGRFLLSQLGEIYDTETAKKVLGDAFLQKNFPPLMLMNPETGQQEPMKDAMGQPMPYDKEMAEVAIAEVLSGELWNYDVSVGEAVASETMRLANAADVKEIATAYPGLIPPDILIEESQLPQSTKSRILSAVKAAQANAQAQAVSAASQPAPIDGIAA